MVGRDRDIQRLGELTGNNVEFRQFSAPASTSSDWSLLDAVSRSAEPSRTASDAPDINHPADASIPQSWSMLTSLDSQSTSQSHHAAPAPHAIQDAEVRPPAAPVTSPTPRPSLSAAGFAHLFRKPSENEIPAATTPLAELLKAISRCP